MSEDGDGANPTPDERLPPGVASDLAAVVEQSRAETAIEALRAEGVYDDTRSVVSDGAETVAVPVLTGPEETDVLDVVRQTDPEPRAPDLRTVLAERGWDDADLETAPGSWAVVGSVVLVRLDCPPEHEREVGEALLELHGEADTVLAREGVAGPERTPQTRVVAGTGDTETVHTEHGTRYALDLSQVMFSPGNKAERARMGAVVDGDDHVFDMFAGVGYFTLPMARAGARVTAAEINPTACRYLVENAALNEVGDRVHAYRADCREVAPGIAGEADRVVMGYYGYEGEGGPDETGADATDVPDTHDHRRAEAHDFLDTAFEALAPGGVVHYHEATPEPLLWDRPESRLRDAADDAGRSVTVEERTVVKSHSEGVQHVVVDARVE